METSFYSNNELQALGFKSIGRDIHISRKCSLYGVEDMIIGNHVRIDDFCILSGKIILGNYIHISSYCGLYGSYGIELENFITLSPRCTLYSASDDFSGEYLVGPMYPRQYNNIQAGRILIKSYASVCTSTCIMPGVEIGEGAVIGAMSFVKKSLGGWAIWVYKDRKMIQIRQRNKKMLELAKVFYND